MKKYKLKIKDDKAEWSDYGLGINHCTGCRFEWLEDSLEFGLSYNAGSESATIFTEEDINKLPYGFVQQHELIEFEEELYHIVCPYTKQLLMEATDGNLCVWDTFDITEDTIFFKRRFTLRTIKDRYPLFKDWAKKVEK